VETSKRFVIGISGASGAVYGIRLLELLADMPDVETHLVISQAGRLTIGLETKWSADQVEALADHVHGPRSIAAPISSGSFPTDAMIVAPCSMKTLSAIVNSYSDGLLARAADVTLKERRPLILMPRESPLHVGHTRLLHQAAEMGIHLCPPMPAFYSDPQSVAEIVDHSVGRVLDLLGIDLGIVSRWTGPPQRSHEI
jgi:4-hydroxy-3-polyprenylbenzoate decarboxylase